MLAPAPQPPAPPPAPASRRRAATARDRLAADRAARWVVAAGGIAIIASVLGILVFIAFEVWPLTRPARVVPGQPVAAPEALAVLGDEYRELAALLTPDGRIVVVGTGDGRVVAEKPLPLGGDGAAASPLVAGAVPPGSTSAAASTADGRVVVQPVAWDVSFDDQQRRSVSPRLGDALVFPLDPAGRPLLAFAAQAGEEGAIAAAQLADGTLVVERKTTSRNAMTGEVTASGDRHTASAVPALSTMVLDQEGRNLYAGTDRGELLWWSIVDGEPQPPAAVSAGRAGISALTLLIGGRALVVGQSNGAVSVWFQVRQADDSFRLQRVRDFPPLGAAVVAFAPSPRNKGFLALDRDGGGGLYYSTSERVLWRGRWPYRGGVAIDYAPKADGALVAGGGRLASLAVHNPHPETTLRSLFGKIWYEGYPEPEYVWQSTGGSDDFESKLSLVPLLVGTLKGTFYSLLLAIPVGVLAAMYASQFMHPRLLRFVKPTVEIMAALPSVVLGFLAGLWLAPRVERYFPSVLLMLVGLPVLVLVAGLLWRRLPRTVLGRLPSGAEVLLHVLVLAGGVALCFAASDAFSRLAFGGTFQQWLLAHFHLPYDQRNAIVVGLAMGFAVIPIIFAIAEDAFSNVPRNLVAGSLALGANRWQTVTRVVLPTASPGIFSAIMIGFGRAVGETMIVLMATGNTPIMTWNPFNGFRTLSANIAVEIPEAPQDGTLYRTLFLAALLLFALTFLVNTAAELVRQRLRRRFAEL